MGIYNATSALLNQLPNGQQPTAQHQLQQQGKQQNGDFDNFPTREDYRNGFTLVIPGKNRCWIGHNRLKSVIDRFEPVLFSFSSTFLG